MTDISKFDDIIDSRDVIARIEELQDEHTALEDTLTEAEEALDAFDPEQGGGDEAELHQNVHHARTALEAWDGAAELATLEALAKEGEQYAPDWRYGATLIRESYFERYCEELVEDIGDMPKGVPSYVVVDWEATARNIKVDYTEVEFDDITYLVR